MAYLVARLFGSNYVTKHRQDSKVLHYRRTPTWRSLVLFTVLVILSHLIAIKAPLPVLSLACYALAIYFSYLMTEKYEEVIFDKDKGTVSLMNSRFFEKHILGYRRLIVSELSEIVGVMVETQIIMGQDGFTVTLLFLSGLTLSLTAQCTFGERTEHDAIAKEVRQFLGLPSASERDAATTSVLTQRGDGKVKRRRNN